MCVTVTLLRCVVYVPITTHNHRRRKGSVVGGHYGECGARVIAGVWRQSPQRGPGAEPLVSGAKPPPLMKLKAFWSLDVQRSRHIYRKQYALLRSTGVRVGGGGRVHGAPNPVIGGLVPAPGSAAYAHNFQDAIGYTSSSSRLRPHPSDCVDLHVRLDVG